MWTWVQNMPMCVFTLQALIALANTLGWACVVSLDKQVACFAIATVCDLRLIWNIPIHRMRLIKRQTSVSLPYLLDRTYTVLHTSINLGPCWMEQYTAVHTSISLCPTLITKLNHDVCKLWINSIRRDINLVALLFTAYTKLMLIGCQYISYTCTQMVSLWKIGHHSLPSVWNISRKFINSHSMPHEAFESMAGKIPHTFRNVW